jgi:hypothetical protein
MDFEPPEELRLLKAMALVHQLAARTDAGVAARHESCSQGDRFHCIFCGKPVPISPKNALMCRHSGLAATNSARSGHMYASDT